MGLGRDQAHPGHDRVECIMSERLLCVLTAWTPKKTREFIVTTFALQKWQNITMTGVLQDGTSFQVFPAVDPRDADRLRGYKFDSVIMLGVPDPVCIEVARWCVR